MKHRKRKRKLWVVLSLAIALVTVQAMQTAAEASAGTVDYSKMIASADSYDELAAAMDSASDGDVIGIGSVITIGSNAEIGFSEGAHVYWGRRSVFGCIEIPEGVIVTIRNVTIDGEASGILASSPMISVSGTLTLENVTVRNCRSSGFGGAVYVSPTGSLYTDNAVFDNNSAEQGGHVYSEHYLNLNNSRFINGTATVDGGAIRSCGGNASLVLTNCVICGNSASTYGGGISNIGGRALLSHSIIFGNSAEFGSDVANDRSASYDEPYGISEVEDLFAAEGVTALGWEFDCADTSSGTVSGFDTGNPDSLKRMNYTVQGADGSGETESGGESGDPGEDADGDDGAGTDGETTDGEDTEQSEDGTVSGNDNPAEDDGGNGLDGSGNGDDGGTVSGSDPSGDSTEAGTDGPVEDVDKQDDEAGQQEDTQGGGSSGDAEATPSVTNNEDNSTTTTTNNYYTYANPSEGAPDKKAGAAVQSTPTSDSGATVQAMSGSASGTTGQSTSGSSSGESEGTETEEDDDETEPMPNVQVPDNISLNLVDVDIIYEMTDGISNIEISNAREEASSPAAEKESNEALSEIPEAADVNEGPLVNWYEVAKLVLLAAIFLTVIPKPWLKRKAKKKRKKKTAVRTPAES